MKRLVALLLLVLCAAPGARAGNSTQIQAESARAVLGAGPGRVVSFWWLPAEYWQACAQELGMSDEERKKIASSFRDYLFIAAVDTKVSVAAKQMESKSIADIVASAKFFRNGEPVEVLREVPPELQTLVYPLSSFMRASLGSLGEGLRLLPLANVDAKGNAILTATTPGELRLELKLDGTQPLEKIYWHAPLTSIAGARTCPKGGETLEASFEWCPWHGVKVGPKN